MASIYQAVRVIAVYLLFSSVLLGILQESPYKPYVRLFTSLLLVLLMVRAFSFFSLDADIEHILEQAVNADDFSTRLEQAQRAGEEQVEEQILKELKQKAAAFLEEFGYKVVEAEITLSYDYQIEAMELEIKKIKKSNRNEDREQIKTALAEYFSVKPENIVLRGGGAYGQMDRGDRQGTGIAD